MTVTLDLTDDTAIITGGGRGIGRAIAKVFSEAGADVVLAARTTSEIEHVAAEVEEEGGTALPVTTDLTNPDDILALVEETRETFGVPDVLVNNAGVNIKAPTLEQPVEEINTMMDVNLRGPILLSQEFGKAYRDAGKTGGRIINIASLHAKQGITFRTVYSGTKAGIYGITRGFAVSLAPLGVTVNSVSPGRIRVGRVEDTIATDNDFYHADRVPAGRLGTADEVAHICLFLASPLAGYITGQDVTVDGGVSITTGAYESLSEHE